MHDPAPAIVEPIAHDLRRAAHMLMTAVGGVYDEAGYTKAGEFLRKLTTPREQL